VSVDLRDALDDVVPTWLAERPVLELLVVLGWPHVGMVVWLSAGREPARGLVAGTVVSLLFIGWLRIQVSDERLRELQRDPIDAVDGVEDDAEQSD